MIGKRKLKQLKTGVHLVCVTDVAIIKDDNEMPFITKEGEAGITIRFSTGDNQHFDQDYWLNGKRHSFFLKMCASAKIDPTSLKFKAEAKGKRLWICINEVHDIDGDKVVLNELEQPVINYYLFDTIPCLDPNKKPIVLGDPGLDGIAFDRFLDYKQVQDEKSLSTVEKNYPAQMKNNIAVFHIEKEALAKKATEEKTLTPSAQKLKEKLSVPEKPQKENIFAKKNREAEEELKTKNDSINWDEL